nr:glycosyltransferase family 2 protein [Motilibacter rhizosphaerae]
MPNIHSLGTDSTRAPLRVLVTAERRDIDPAGPSVSVVVPAMNEAKNLPWLAAHMPAGVAEIILVDGRSVDDTVEVARALWPDVRVVTQTRRGKGNALACGFHAATGDITVMIDADGSMDPGEIPFFVDALVAGADYAKGSRFSAGGGSSDITRVRSWGNWALNALTNTVHGTRYRDLCYGYNAFWTRILPVLDMDAGQIGDDSDERKWGDGFEVETLINIRVHTAGLTIAEVASFESERLHGQSNLNAVSDGLRVLRTIAIEKREVLNGQRLRSLSQNVTAPAPLDLEPLGAASLVEELEDLDQLATTEDSALEALPEQVQRERVESVIDLREEAEIRRPVALQVDSEVRAPRDFAV